MIRANDNGGHPHDPSQPAGFPTSTSLVPGRAPGPEQDTMAKVRAVLAAFRRRWFLALFLGLACGAGAAAAAWCVLPAPYTAQADLIVSPDHNRILFKTAEERANFNTWKQTQMKRANRPEMLAGVLRDPEVARLKMIQSQAHPVHWLEQNLKVGHGGTEFIRLSLAGEERHELPIIVNAVAEAFRNEVLGADTEHRLSRQRRLEEAYSKAEQELREKERGLRSLSESLQAANTQQANQRQRYLLDLAIQMRRELADVHMQLMATKLHLGEELNDPDDADTQLRIPKELVDARVDQEPEVRNLILRISQLESYAAQFQKGTQGGEHPRYVETQKQIEQSKQRLAELRHSLRTSVEESLTAQITANAAAKSAAAEAQNRRQARYLEARKQQLEEELDSVKIREEQTGLLAFELQAVNNQIQQSQTLVEQIASEIAKMNIEKESPIYIAFHERATAPLFRDQKKKYAGTGLAGLGMFALIVAGIVWLEIRAQRISLMDEVVDDLSLGVLGTVPMMPRLATSSRNGRARAKTAYWQNVLTESIDSTRTMLLRKAHIDSVKCVMIASAMGNEGKTTLSCHLATSIARAGRKVVLVDCDLRRPSVHRVFDLPQSPGVCELLRGKAELAEALQHAAPAGLAVISAGKVCPEALQELAHDGLESILTKLNAQFDFVIVDSSPILPVTDALLVAQHVDGVVMSIRRDVSRTAKVLAACQRISLLGVPMLGSVVIGLDEGIYGARYPYRYGYGPYELEEQPAETA